MAGNIFDSQNSKGDSSGQLQWGTAKGESIGLNSECSKDIWGLPGKEQNEGVTAGGWEERFPGGPVESTLECKGHGFNPWSWKILNGAEQLSQYATTAKSVLTAQEPQLLKPTCCDY